MAVTNADPARELHAASVVVDGLYVPAWSEAIVQSLTRGGVTAANVTCCIWEGLDESLRQIAAWHERIARDDRLTLVRSVDDVEEAKRDGRIGIVLGWQNSTGFGEHLPYVRLFGELGLRVVQLTYNTANGVGSGCYESRDGGLTDFGRDLVAALNEQGILIDLSHVGTRTAADAIHASSVPVAYTHVLPRALHDHPRNKTDAELEAIGEADGFVGVTAYPAFLARGTRSTWDDYLDAAEHVGELVGWNRVGIGTDFTEGQDRAFFDYITRDRGVGRRLVDLRAEREPEVLRSAADLPQLTAAALARGWSAKRITGFLGANWLTFLDSVWGARDG